MLAITRVIRRIFIYKKWIRPRVYVGCALTHAPESFRSEVTYFKEYLKKRGWIVLDFIGLENGTARDVYVHDIKKCVGRCDLMVAISDYPSSGLGYELATAVEAHGVWAIAVAHANAQVSRFFEGINHRRFLSARYKNLQEVEGYMNDMIWY